MKVRRPYAFCCIEGGGRPSGCLCANPDHGYAIVDVRKMLAGDQILSGCDPIEILIAWAREQAAFPEGNVGGEGRGHIDENHRFKLRDLVGAIDAGSKPPAGGEAGAVEESEAERIGLAVADLVERHLTNPAMIWGLPELPDSWMTELRSILVASLESELAVSRSPRRWWRGSDAEQ